MSAVDMREANHGPPGYVQVSRRHLLATAALRGARNTVSSPALDLCRRISFRRERSAWDRGAARTPEEARRRMGHSACACGIRRQRNEDRGAIAGTGDLAYVRGRS